MLPPNLPSHEKKRAPEPIFVPPQQPEYGAHVQKSRAPSKNQESRGAQAGYQPITTLLEPSRMSKMCTYMKIDRQKYCHMRRSRTGTTSRTMT